MMIFDMPTISSWARGRKVRARRVLTRGCRVRRSRGSSTLGVAMPMKRWIWWRCIAVTMSRVPSTSGRPVAFLLMSGPREVVDDEAADGAGGAEDGDLHEEAPAVTAVVVARRTTGAMSPASRAMDSTIYLP